MQKERKRPNSVKRDLVLPTLVVKETSLRQRDLIASKERTKANSVKSDVKRDLYAVKKRPDIQTLEVKET